MSKEDLHFFASMNTAYGFHSDFHSIFDADRLRKIYILKGGPGCGKSSLMKSIAESAEAGGKTVERFFCSSDPNSLDGIIINENNVAIIDGTAPHQSDPNFPGVVESIVNLGSFWDIKKILNHKKEIIELIQDKKIAYQSAYQFLGAYGKVLDEILRFTKKAILEEKMLRNVKTQCNYVFKKEQRADVKIRNVETICKDGILRFDTFERNSKKIWIVEDYLHTGCLYLEAVESYAKQNNQTYYKSLSPHYANKINAIYFPKTKACFVLGKRDYSSELTEKEYHYVNMKRFLNSEKIAQGKRKIKFAVKCTEELLSAATEALKDAAQNHKKLEQFYITAMDFEKIDKIQCEIKSDIFQTQDTLFS